MGVNGPVCRQLGSTQYSQSERTLFVASASVVHHGAVLKGGTPKLGSILAAFGEYQVFQVTEDGEEARVVGFTVLGPTPWTCATYETLREAMETAHRLHNQLKNS